VGAVREHRSGDAMTGTADWLLWGIAALAILVSFANPAGSSSAPRSPSCCSAVGTGLPFVGDYLKSRQSGVGQAKAQRKLRDTMRRNDDERGTDEHAQLAVDDPRAHRRRLRGRSPPVPAPRVGAVAATSAYGTVVGTFWTLVGVFMIIGGLQIIGGLIIAVAWYLARGNYKRYKQEGGLRAALNG